MYSSYRIEPYTYGIPKFTLILHIPQKSKLILYIHS